ncbi:MAG: PAS domain-containing protein [archaeon]
MAIPGRASIQVLHVDADMRFSSMASALLERKNDDLVVFTEATGVEGLDRLESEAIDCVVCGSDAGGGMRGVEFIEAVKERYPSMPVVVFADPDEKGYAEKVFEAGAIDFVRDLRGSDQYSVLARRIVQAVEQTGTRSTKSGRSPLDSLLDEDFPVMLYQAEPEVTTPMDVVVGGCDVVSGYPAHRFESGDLTWGRDLIHPEDRRERWSEIKLAIEDREPFELSYRITGADGDEHWVEEYGEGQYDNAGNPTGIAGFITNVMGPSRWEAQFKRERNMLESLLNHLPETIFFKDKQGRHVRASRALHEMHEDLIGKTDKDLYDEELADTSYRDDLRVVETETPIVDKVEPTPSSPETDSWTMTTKVPWYSEDGTVEGLIGHSKTVSNTVGTVWDRTRKRQLGDIQVTLEEEVRSVLEEVLDIATIPGGVRDQLETVTETLEEVLDRIGGRNANRPQATTDFTSIIEAAWAVTETEATTLEIEDDDVPVTGNLVRLQRLFEELFRYLASVPAVTEIHVRQSAESIAVEADTDILEGYPDGDLTIEQLLARESPGKDRSLELTLINGIAETQSRTVDISRTPGSGIRFDISRQQTKHDPPDGG